jgi:hypothetical protein
LAARRSCGLATEFCPNGQNENSEKKLTVYRKPAIAFDSCYAFGFLFISIVGYASAPFLSQKYYFNF